MKAVIRADAAYERAHFHLGLLYLKVNKPQKARDAFQNTVTLNSSHTDASILLSYTHYLLSNHSEAITALSTVSLADILSYRQVDAVSLAGNSYIALGRYDDAQELFEAVLRMDTDNLRALNGLGDNHVVHFCHVLVVSTTLTWS